MRKEAASSFLKNKLKKRAHVYLPMVCSSVKEIAFLFYSAGLNEYYKPTRSWDMEYIWEETVEEEHKLNFTRYLREEAMVRES